MEEKKLDINSLIGFLLIGGILLWMLYMNPSAPEVVEEPANDEVVVTPDAPEEVPQYDAVQETDSAAVARAAARLGAFGYSATLPSASKQEHRFQLK